MLKCDQCSDTGIYYELTPHIPAFIHRCFCAAGDEAEIPFYVFPLAVLGFALIGASLWGAALWVIYKVVCG